MKHNTTEMSQIWGEAIKKALKKTEEKDFLVKHLQLLKIANLIIGKEIDLDPRLQTHGEEMFLQWGVLDLQEVTSGDQAE